MKSFQGKVAVITGAGSGIGRSLALQLNQAGARLALCDLNLEDLAETISLLPEKSSLASTHQVDVAIRDQMERFAAEVVSQHGQVDLLINNAGITIAPAPFDDISDEYFQRIIDINFWGVYNGFRTFLPHLKTRPEASIITISSLAGLIGLSGYSPYAVSKFGARALSESLAMELSPTSVHVMVVFPGGVKTSIIKNAPNLDAVERDTAHQAFTRSALLTTDTAASKILQAARKERHRLILGVDARLAYLIRRLFPQSYPRILNAVFGRMGFE